MLARRTSVLEAVSAAIAADPAFTQKVTGGVWTGEVPEGRAMPYASLEVDSTDWDLTAGGADLERTRFSVVLFGTGAKALDDLLDEVQTFLLETAEYQWANADWLAFAAPVRRTTRGEFARDAQGRQVFTGALMFEFGVFRH